MDCRIEELKGVRYLRSGENATQSAINLQQPHHIELQNLEYAMGCLMFMEEPQNILLLGVGGGSLIHFFRHHCPNAHITGVDIDAELLHTMHNEFLLPQADEFLSYQIADAQTWVMQSTQQFDLIIVDLFSEQHMPDWVLEIDFMDELKRLLNTHGCVSWNTLIPTEQAFNQFYSNLRTTFNHRTLCLAADDYENTIAYSFNFDLKQTDMGYLLQLAQQKSTQFKLPFHSILSIIFSTNPIDSGFI